MKLLELTLSFEPGGRREAVLTLARGLAAEGAPCDLACVERLGCEPHVVSGFGAAEVLARDQIGTTKAVARLVRLCDDRRIGLIHAHDAASQWVAALARLLRPKTKLLMTFHRSLGFESAGWKAKLRNAMAGMATVAIVVGSRDRHAHYLRENFVSKCKVVRIPFGIDMKRFRRDAVARHEIRKELGVGEGDLLVGAAGHFGEEKGIDLAMEGFLAFRERKTEKSAKLVVVGRGTPEQEAAMKQLGQRGGVAVCFAGFRKDVERYFAAMDVFLHVPRQEAFGLVVAEAMACGVPVVGANVGGVPDMVRDGLTGILVQPGQTAEVAGALAKLAADEALRERLSAEAARVAQAEYSETLYVRRHVDLYEQILAGRQPRGVDEGPGNDETRRENPNRPAAGAVAQEVCDV